MKIKFDPHAIIRMRQRGTDILEVKKTITNGKRIKAKFGRKGFTMDLDYNAEWNNKIFKTKQVIAYAEQEDDTLIVITVITKFF